MNDSVKAILLDADGVLQTAAHDWVVALRGIGGAAFPAAVFEHERPAMRGEITMREAIIAAAGEVGATIDVEETLELWSRFELDPQAMDFVAELRRAGLRCYLVTNQQDVRRDIMREQYGDALDGYFFSCEVGAAKPEAEFFERVLSTRDLSPSECVFFDDSRANVEAARRMGIRSHLVAGGSVSIGLRAALTDAGLQPAG